MAMAWAAWRRRRRAFRAPRAHVAYQQQSIVKYGARARARAHAASAASPVSAPNEAALMANIVAYRICLYRAEASGLAA